MLMPLLSHWLPHHATEPITSVSDRRRGIEIMRTVTALSAAFGVVFCAAGCTAFQSPAVGDWQGTMSASPGAGGLGALAIGFAAAATGNTPANLTLKNDGTGYLKLPTAPERPMTWKMDGDRVLLFVRRDAASTPASGNNASDTALVGKLSEEKKTLTFDLGPVQFAMTKQPK